MITIEFPITAKELGERFSATVVGSEATEISSLAPLKSAVKGSLSFITSKKHAGHLEHLQGAVLFAKPELVKPDLPVTYLVVENPQLAFSKVAHFFRPSFHWAGISEKAVIHPEAKLEEGVCVGPFAVLCKGVRVGKDSKVGSFAYLGNEVVVGKDCEIFPRATLLDGVCLGDRVKVFPGVVIGSDGFGFFPQEGASTLAEMPQIGSVTVEDDVRIGANSTIDRATIGETRIGQGSKLDDQVHVGHNTQVGKNCVLCGQTGLAGSAELEENVMLAGQSGVGDGVKVGKGARIGAHCGVLSPVKGDDTYFMTPATPVKLAFRMIKYMRKLPELFERVKQLESKEKGKH